MMKVLSTIRYPAKMRATFCATDSRAYQVSEIKNAGGNPPALGQPSDAERWLLFTIDNNILPRKSYEFGESLADWFLYSIKTFRLQVAQVVFLECSPFAKEQHISDLAAKTSVEPLSANLFEVVLLEISDTSEKFDIGSRFQVPFVSFRPVGNRCALLVKNEYDKVKIGSKCRIARFVYENRQLPHEPTPFKIKMSGGKPPDARRSLYSRKPLILYHAEHFLSSRNCNKQMFEIQCKLAA